MAENEPLHRQGPEPGRMGRGGSQGQGGATGSKEAKPREGQMSLRLLLCLGKHVDPGLCFASAHDGKKINVT